MSLSPCELPAGPAEGRGRIIRLAAVGRGGERDRRRGRVHTPRVGRRGGRLLPTASHGLDLEIVRAVGEVAVARWARAGSKAAPVEGRGEGLPSLVGAEREARALARARVGRAVGDGRDRRSAVDGAGVVRYVTGVAGEVGRLDVEGVPSFRQARVALRARAGGEAATV